ncbi:MAG: hypothetical protein LBK95_20675 [Bifidobacteriaceae bacterium]|jgi:hypothetical protein|nr:hypothetical protein [Bifidobacteriaceae bacterium]
MSSQPYYGPPARPKWKRGPAGNVILVLIVLLVIVVAAGLPIYQWGKANLWWDVDEDLKPLVDDPMADKRLLGMKSLEAGYLPAAAARESALGSLLDEIGVSPGPWVDRVFEAGDQGGQAAFDSVIEAAQAEGWTIAKIDDTDQYGFFGGVRMTKPAGDRDMELVVYAYESTEGGDRISLELTWAATGSWGGAPAPAGSGASEILANPSA